MTDRVRDSKSSILLLLKLTTYVAIFTTIAIPVASACVKVGVFFAPLHLLGRAFNPIAAVFMLGAPWLFVLLVILLIARPNRPIATIVFLVVACGSVALLFFGNNSDESVLTHCQIATIVLFSLSLVGVVEAYCRDLPEHRLTTYVSVAFASCYWIGSLAIFTSVLSRSG